MQQISLLLKQLCLWGLNGFLVCIRPFLGPRGVCRFSPTCSEYAKQALTKYGVLKGTYLAVRRVLKCHPFHQGGYDPVP